MRRAALALTLTLTATSAPALDLTLTGQYALNRPASLEYDPTFCGLWVANEAPEAVLYTLQGEELRRLSSDLSRIKALTLDGDTVLVSDGYGRMQRLAKDGTALGDPFPLDDVFSDTEGMVVDGDGLIVTVEDDPERLSWFAPDGSLVRRINTLTLTPPLYEAQGIARDPRTGYLLVVDDAEGSNSLYEFTPEGELLATVSLRPYGLDPEGIAIRPGSGQLFVAFDQGASIATFDYTPTLPPDAAPLRPGADCMMF